MRKILQQFLLKMIFLFRDKGLKRLDFRETGFYSLQFVALWGIKTEDVLWWTQVRITSPSSSERKTSAPPSLTIARVSGERFFALRSSNPEAMAMLGFVLLRKS
jgi:hypothetical protein